MATDVTAAITTRVQNGHLALGIYLIPGFPDWATSLLAVRAAVRLGVDFVEFPVIRDPDWSPRTGSVIAAALRHSLQARVDSVRWSAWAAETPCSVGVVYRSAWPGPQNWRPPLELPDTTGALLLEMSGDDAAYAAATTLPVIATVDGTQAGLTAAERQSLRHGGGFVYAALAQRTGDPGADTLGAAKSAAIQAARPDLPVCCAFGITSADDVMQLRDSRTCDGAIVGTAALLQLADGIDTFTSWLADLLAAARSPARPSPASAS